VNRLPIPLTRLAAVLLAAAAMIACTQATPSHPTSQPSPAEATLNTPASKGSALPSLTAVSPEASQTLAPSTTATITPTPIPSSSPTVSPTPTISSTPTLSPTPTVTPSPTVDVRPDPANWRSWQTVPTVSAVTGNIFKRGQELGNDIHAFTRIGDCQSVPAVFLGIYDTDRYWFGEKWQYLQRTVDQFAGAWERENVTARDGFSVLSMFSALYADPKLCNANETPLECEYRLYKPAFAFISLGTNWQPGASARFEEYLRKIVDFCIEHGIVPILMTKADNVEGDELLNKAIAQVAHDYDVPMLNSWLAVYYLANHGLDETGIYLTPDAWDERAFSALLTLDKLWTQLSGVEMPTATPAP
jgi:hypothetical protein